MHGIYPASVWARNQLERLAICPNSTECSDAICYQIELSKFVECPIEGNPKLR
jgi:hypothetical protein